MCSNSDGGSGQTYGASYYNRKFGPLPDNQLKFANVPYNDPGAYRSGVFSINGDDNYYTRSDWSAVPSLPNGVNGYVATRNSSGSCS